MSENKHNGLVDESKCREVTSVCTGGFEDYAEFLAKSVIIISFDHDSTGKTVGEECYHIRSRSKKEDHTKMVKLVSTYPASADLTRVVRVAAIVREDSHEGVREADFGSINRAIAGCFDKSKYFSIARAEYDTLDGALCQSEHRLCKWRFFHAFSGFIVRTKSGGPAVYLAKYRIFHLVIIQSLKASVA